MAPDDAPESNAGVCVFGPAPVLTVTIERHGDDERVHVHCGGQGLWVARMVHRMGTPARLVGCFGGETGLVARLLVEAEGIDVSRVEVDADNSAYVHDRRSGEREVVAEAPFATLDRHALDELYSATLAAALDAGVCVLAGTPAEEVLPVDTYRRLASDLRSNGVEVIADLRGEQLRAALAGGISSLKISHEELHDDGLVEDADDVADLVAAAAELHATGADDVIVSRAGDPAIASLDGAWCLVQGPEMQVVDHHGAGDSMTAALAVGASRGLTRVETVRLAAAAGSLNVTRHGLATGQADAIDQIAQRIELRELEV